MNLTICCGLYGISRPSTVRGRANNQTFLSLAPSPRESVRARWGPIHKPFFCPSSESPPGPCSESSNSPPMTESVWKK